MIFYQKLDIRGRVLQKQKKIKLKFLLQQAAENNVAEDVRKTVVKDQQSDTEEKIKRTDDVEMEELSEAFAKLSIE